MSALGAAAVTSGRACPCGGGAYAACCGPAHEGRMWPDSAEALMRSRYAAYALGMGDYVWRTWHPRTRPASVELEPSLQWTGLVILAVEGGTPEFNEGVVEFAARWSEGGRAGVLRERSRFGKRAGRWFYVDADPS